MRVSVEGGALSAAIKITATSVGTKSIPVMQGVVIEADEGVATLSTFDYDSAATAIISSAVVGKAGRLLVSHRLLSQVAAQCGSGEVLLDDADGQLAVAAGRAKWRLPLMSIEDFPSLPAVDEADDVLTSAAEFADAVERVAVAASEKIDATPPLDVVRLLVGDNEVTLAALDGYRLHTDVVTATCAGDDVITLVPARKLLAMVKHLGGGELRIVRSESLLQLATPRARLTTRLADNSHGWAKAEGLIQRSRDEELVSVIVDREAFRRALRQVGAFAEEAAQGHRHVTLSFQPDGRIEATAGTNAEGSGASEVESVHDGPGLRLVSNLPYLLAALDTSETPTVRLSFYGPEKPIGFGTEATPVIAVVMPLRAPACTWLDDPTAVSA